MDIDKLNEFIQNELKIRELDSVEPVIVEKWLVNYGHRKKLGSRPGSYVRSFCRKGKIIGAVKNDSKWTINYCKDI